MIINNKGQVLITFILILPIILLLVGYVLNESMLVYEKNKLDNINIQVIEEYLNEEEADVNSIRNYILKNDEDIIIDKIEIDEDYINIKITKNVDSFFAIIIGKKYFVVNSDIKKKR